jgi:aspartyl-tRNA(Asn)/glutamyl-tRNA(Gln) amidotransferase subunit C
MKKEEVEHLAMLSRIKLEPEEVTGFSGEISEILEYVGKIKELTVEGTGQPVLTPRYNVFREDEVTNEPGSYSEDLIEAMPSKRGRHLVVKKILSHD